MSKPKSILIWHASDKLLDILANEYLLRGAMGASLWSLGDSEFDKEFSHLNPGTLVLLFRSEHNNTKATNAIAGGAYFLGWRNFSVQDTWELYGVTNGAYSYEDFVQEVKSRGGNEQSTLSVALLAHTFIFDIHDYVYIPEELTEFLSEQRIFILPLDTPTGRYIRNRVLEHRESYIGADGSDWQGMYHAASHRNSKTYVAEFYSRVLNAYNFRCALSGVNARPVLSVAHIQPFYDSKFQASSNGVVLRSDLYQLFKAGYITFEYQDRGQRLVAKVSNTVRAAYGEDYMVFDGQELLLPEDKSNWPDPRYVKWHNNNCFERWLHISGRHSFSQQS